jgi:hypothetical protein
MNAAFNEPVRSTSVKVVEVHNELGMARAEDMHGIACVIDQESSLGFQVVAGQILDASISQDGRVLSAVAKS